MALLRRVMSQVQRNILEGIRRLILRLGDELVDGVGEEAFVLRLRLERLTAHPHRPCGGIVPWPHELQEFDALRAVEIEGAWLELHHDFPRGGMRLAEVCGVSPSEGLLRGLGRVEGFGELGEQRHFPRGYPHHFTQLLVLFEFAVGQTRETVGRRALQVIMLFCDGVFDAGLACECVQLRIRGRIALLRILLDFLGIRAGGCGGDRAVRLPLEQWVGPT